MAGLDGNPTPALPPDMGWLPRAPSMTLGTYNNPYSLNIWYTEQSELKYSAQSHRREALTSLNLN